MQYISVSCVDFSKVRISFVTRPCKKLGASAPESFISFLLWIFSERSPFLKLADDEILLAQANPNFVQFGSQMRFKGADNLIMKYLTFKSIFRIIAGLIVP